MGSLSNSPHFAIFPFMAQGHTIPLLHLSRLLLCRTAAVTVFTTAGNSPSIRASLHGTGVNILELSFPQNIEGVPSGVENTHQLPSMLSFLPFVRSTKLMQPSFEKLLETLNPPVSCVISDGFLDWTLESANRFGVPRFAFFGMGNFSCTMYNVLGRETPHAKALSPDDPFEMPGFPGRMLTRKDFEPPFDEVAPSGPYAEFMMEQLIAMARSHGVIVNSFVELERRYADYWNEKIGPKVFNVGPLCACHVDSKPASYVEFLDGKLSEGEPVLYVSFGTQARVPAEQVEEIAIGLERSEVSFLWAVDATAAEVLKGFKERVKVGNRGIVVNGWVDQIGILRHCGVKGFLSHCGWNSVVESITAGVPIIALPFMAEQHMNARFVAEEAGVGLRIMPEGGTVRGFVAAEEVERVVRELMGDGEKGAEVRRKAGEYGVAARRSMSEGGSSARTLDMLVDEISGKTSSTAPIESKAGALHAMI